MAERWSPLHLRLHRHLLRQPALLPQSARLLVAVSGGQDSMALVALLQDLKRLHHWELQLWHGDHRWRPESSQQATELAAWAEHQGLPIAVTGGQLPAAAKWPPGIGATAVSSGKPESRIAPRW